MAQAPRVEVFRDQFVLQPNPVSGGMADVYHAKDALNDMREVAVKLFRRTSNEEDILREVFKRETRALKELKHPNIVELHDSGFDEGRQSLFLVLEWIPFDLTSYLQKNPTDGWDTFYQQIGKPILEALSFAHSRKIAHRDLKPENTHTPNPASLSSSPLPRHPSFIRAVCVDAHVRIRPGGAQ